MKKRIVVKGNPNVDKIGEALSLMMEVAASDNAFIMNQNKKNIKRILEASNKFLITGNKYLIIRNKQGGK